jgi:predicted TIM-barrel fold metal-dependent hydrolase
MLGVRFTYRRPEEIATLSEPDKAWIWTVAESANVPLMLYPPGLLDRVDVIAARHPGLRIIIDHMAFDRAKGPAAFARLPELLALAKHPNVGVKVSALPFYSTQPYPFPELHEPLRRTYDAFGPQRLFWGSDVSRLPCPYTQAVTLFTEELSWLGEYDKEWIMGRGLSKWLGWPWP